MILGPAPATLHEAVWRMRSAGDAASVGAYSQGAQAQFLTLALRATVIFDGGYR